MKKTTLFTAMTKLRVVKDGASIACVGIESDSPMMNIMLEYDGALAVQSYLNVIAAGVAGIIQKAHKGDPQAQATDIRRFFDSVEDWIGIGIQITNNPETL